MKGAICVPAHGDWAGKFGQSLVALATYCHAQFPPETDDFALFYEGGSVLPAVRNSLAQRALEYGADWILWIDSDMVFPHDALHRLLAHQVSIVGCNYPRRVDPFTPTAVALPTDKEKAKPHYGADEALTEVHHAGMGLMLTRTQVFKDLKELDPKAPWFGFPWNPVRQVTTGEDVAMQSRARVCGHKTYIDNALSEQISHVAEVPVDMTWARQWKEGMGE
jgi:hypothetical protein